GPNLEFPDDNTDRAIVGLGSPFPRLTANRTIGELLVQSGRSVSNGDGTTNFSLVVQNNGGLNGTTTVTGAGSDVFVHQSPSAIDLDTDIMLLTNGGSLYIYDGARVQADDRVAISANSSLGGNGILEFGFNATTSTNDGLLSGGGEGTLVVRAIADGTFDPDGLTGNGQLYAFFNSRLHIQAPLQDAIFNGIMTVHSNGEIRIDEFWELGAGGTLNLDGTVGAGAADTATLAGGSSFVSLAGLVHVNNGTGIFDVQTIVRPTASFTVHTGANVQFNQITHFEDPDTIVNQFDTTWTINNQVYIQGTGNFNWDGLGQNGIVQGATIVNPDGQLRINVSQLDEQGLDDRVSADLTINGGYVDVQIDDGQWELEGTLTMRNPDGQSPAFLNGFDGDEVLLTGDVIVEGTGVSRISARSVFSSSSHVHV
ncbi:MAG TPA: hypothetical protein VIY86_02790, partial [Pirellulaceae bacterium]